METVMQETVMLGSEFNRWIVTIAALAVGLYLIVRVVQMTIYGYRKLRPALRNAPTTAHKVIGVVAITIVLTGAVVMFTAAIWFGLR
jgi:hypothetical protein